MLPIKRFIGTGIGIIALLTGGLATAPTASAAVGDTACLFGNFSGGTGYETSDSSLCVRSYSNYN
ncbi:hypothetical protein ACFXKJ_41420, partial [Kitasatospora indigofera]